MTAPSQGWVEVKRWNGTKIDLQVAKRPLPRRGGNSVFLVCNRSQKPRRALYGREAIKHAHYLPPRGLVVPRMCELELGIRGRCPDLSDSNACDSTALRLAFVGSDRNFGAAGVDVSGHAYEWGLVEGVYRGRYKVYLGARKRVSCREWKGQEHPRFGR